MSDLKNIEDYYKSISIPELQIIARKAKDLKLEVIAILQKELLLRGQTEDALKLTDFLVQSKKERRYSDMSVAEIKVEISDRLENGDSIEVIKLDLKDDGINIFDILDNDNKLKEKAFDYITHLKRKGLDKDQIDEKLKETLSLNQDDSDMLKIQLIKSGKTNLIVGYSLLVIAVILTVVSLAIGRVTFGAIALLIIGIWRIIKGYEQIKE